MLSSLSALAGDAFQAVEPALWVAYFIALAPVSSRAVRRIVAAGQLHQLLGVTALAVAFRLLSPWEPIYWHYPLMNLHLGDELYTRQNSYLPYVLRVSVFELHGGFDAALVFNLIAGTVSIGLLWYTALMAGHPRRVCLLFGALLALIPMYVRQSASDDVYITILLLYASAGAAFATLSAGTQRRYGVVLLVTSVLLGMPIRGESAIVFSSIPLFWLHGSMRLKELLKPKRRNVVLAASLAMGAIVVYHLQHASLDERAHLDGTSLLFGLVTQSLCVLSPLFFPPLIAVPIWLMTWHLMRERRWRNLLSIHLPIWVGRVPHLFGCAFMLSLA